MPAPIPPWIVELQALLTPTIAVVVAIITFKQWRLAARKLALDLFDKRMRVYVSLVEAAKQALNGRPRPSADAVFDFARAKHDARFLFGDEVISYLRDVESA